MSRLASVAVIGVVCGLVQAAASAAEPQSTQERPAAMHAPVATPFGTLPDGRTVNLWTLAVPGGWKATISEYGAILTGLHVPAKEVGAPVDVVLGFDTLDPWKECGDCAFMPVCAGGCVTASYSQLGDVNTPTCHKPAFESAVIALAHRTGAQQETLQ